MAEFNLENDGSRTANPVKGPGLAAFALGFILFGGMWVAFGAWESRHHWGRMAGTERTQGVIAQVIRGASDEADVLVVNYDVGGRSFQTRHQVRISPGPYSAGQAVAVRYPPNEPQDGVVDTFWETWGLLAGLGGFGLIFVAVGLGVWWFGVRPALRGQRDRSGRIGVRSAEERT